MHVYRSAMLKTAFLGFIVMACGTKQQQPANTSKKATSNEPNAPTTVTRRSSNNDGDAGAASPATSGSAAAPPKEEKPFAGSAAEATSMISAVVDKKQDEIATCIREYRVRKKLAHERVSVSFGIDQEGRLLGVTSKGKEDAELKGCVQGVLKNAAFPRSHAGVITVTKSYEEIIK